MKTSYVVSVAAALCLSTWRLSVAADNSEDMKAKPGVVEAAAASVTGTVESIDYQTRAVTLKGRDGKTMSMVVGPEAVRFNEVKKGDVVKIDYLESVAIVVQSSHETMDSAQGSGSVIIRNKGKKPSGMAVDTQVKTATVVKINAKKRTAVLRTPDGEEFPINIAPDVKHVENVKKGDQVIVRYTRSVAIDVSKPETK